MNKQKVTQNALATLMIVILLATLAYANPVYNQVTFLNPLNIGAQQTISANISTNDTISSVLIEVNGINYSMTLNNDLYTYSYTPNTGINTFNIHAIDNISTSPYQGTFTVKDLTPPAITVISPVGTINYDTIELKVSTDENSNCKYDTLNRTYSLMSSFFQTTGSTTHQSILTHVATGAKTYYASCKDIENNEASALLNFIVNLGPSAQITLSKSSPLKADTYKVTLTASKPLAQTPTLQYKYDDEQKYYSISLIGQDTTWNGYLVITPDSKDRVGTFSYSGLDYDGLTGTRVSSGAMFIVDTTKPEAPISIDSIIKDSNIEISWFYEGEAPDHFNIYRSTASGVEYVDYYDDNPNTPFKDTDVDDGITYYYRTAAVDKAGNVGDLSSETHITFEELENDTDTTSVPEEKLSSTLERKLNQTYATARTLRFDIEYAISQLEKETDRFKTSAINELNLIENARSEKSIADNILSELDGLRSQDISQSEFDARINTIEDKIDKIRTETITEIIIIDSLEFTQRISQSDITSAVNEIFLRQDMNQDLKENYTGQAETLQDMINIFETVTLAKTVSLNGEEEHYSIIQKEITSSGDALDVILYENIPKTFAESSKDIIFHQNPKIIKDDPILYWDVAKIDSTKISYYTKEQKTLDDAKDSKTIVLPNPAKFISRKGIYSETGGANKVTGNAIISTETIKRFKEYIFIGIGVLVISALGIYYFYFLSDSRIGEDDEESDNILSVVYSQPSQQIETSAAKNTNQIPDEATNKHLMILIDHAEEHAHNMNFIQAAKEYELIYTLFNSTSFNSPEFKRMLSEKITSLHKKISVKKNIHLAQDSIAKGDKAAVKKAFEELSQAHSAIKKDSLLKDYLSRYNAHYSKMLLKSSKSIKKSKGKKTRRK